MSKITKSDVCLVVKKTNCGLGCITVAGVTVAGVPVAGVAVAGVAVAGVAVAGVAETTYFVSS